MGSWLWAMRYPSAMTARVSPAPTLLDLSPAASQEALKSWALDRKLPAYRGRQIHRRLWQAPVRSWSEATELPAGLRTELEDVFSLPSRPPDVVQRSADGTRKYLWRLHDGEAVESVLIPSGGRRTLCIS